MAVDDPVTAAQIAELRRLCTPHPAGFRRAPMEASVIALLDEREALLAALREVTSSMSFPGLRRTARDAIAKAEAP